MAEGILRNRIEEAGLKAIVDSAGTADYHVGEPPDFRAIHTLKSKGIDISGLAARQFTERDFDEFDLIFAMDSSNLNNILSLARTESDKEKVHLILDSITPGMNRSVPDPFYGDLNGFENVYQLLDQATTEIIRKMK
jgi:protein-tyrosine phosphatase